MAEQNFEALVDRLFADAPAFSDAPRFAARVESRLDRAWNVRGLLIGGLGLAGGLIGGAQVLGSGVAGRLGALTQHSRDIVQMRLGDFAGALALPGGFAINPEVVMMSAALLAVAIGLGLTRMIREL